MTFTTHSKPDELEKSCFIPFSVIPADPGLTISRAGPGIQSFQAVLDPGVRRGDDMKDLLRLHQIYYGHVAVKPPLPLFDKVRPGGIFAGRLDNDALSDVFSYFVKKFNLFKILNKVV